MTASTRGRDRRMIRLLPLAPLFALLTLLLPASAASAQVPAAGADVSGYATGTVLHADVLEQGGTRLENTDIAFSASALDTLGLTPEILNEMDRLAIPEDASKNTYARGSGLEVGMAVTPEDPNQVILAGLAEEFAPPSDGEPTVEQHGPVPAEPAAWASLARGSAIANWHEDLCPIASEISAGLGYVADAQLVETGGDPDTEGMDAPLLATNAPGNDRSVSWSLSRQFLAPQQGGTGFGLVSEVRETIAPVTFFAGTASQFTIEILGEWVLRATALGTDGGATIHYGPEDDSPETVVIRLLDAAGNPTAELTTQQLLTDEGLVVAIPGAGGTTLAEIAIGEDPRAIDGDATTEPTTAADGTEASAAVDVVRVNLLEQTDELGNVTFRASQVRLGHMETRAAVPDGGIACDLPVDKVANPTTVDVGETFQTPITVHNPFDCELTDVRIEDVITTRNGATFTVESTDPTAATVPAGTDLTSGTIIWEGLGPIAAGGSLTVTATFTATSDGIIEDTATATAVLGECRGSGVSAEVVGAASALEGASVSGVSPTVEVAAAAVLGVQLPRTGPGAAATMAFGSALLALAAVVRRRFG